MKEIGCEGCNIQDECLIDPSFRHVFSEYVCPCQKCLVKVMCKKPCDDMTDYITYYYKYKENNDHVLLINDHTNYYNTLSFRFTTMRDVTILCKSEETAKMKNHFKADARYYITCDTYLRGLKSNNPFRAVYIDESMKVTIAPKSKRKIP